MKARRKFYPVLAQRMLAVRDRLDARFDVLLEEAAPALAAARTVAEAKKIVQAIVDDLVTILDEEEAATLQTLFANDHPTKH